MLASYSGKLFRLDVVYSLMKAKNPSTFALLLIIAILGGYVVYEFVQRHQATKGDKQFGIAFGVQLYQGLQRGDVEGVKRRLGGFVAANSLLYEQQYGHETNTKFALRLVEAKAIREGFQLSST